MNLAVTASEAAALDAIVFMNDGSDAAATTTVSYTEASALTLKASLAGVGIFTAKDSGKLTISGDSHHFMGKFILDDVDTLVTHPYGLGSDNAATTQVKCGANKYYCHFDDGTDVFTNHAPISIWSTVKGQAPTFGSESLSKTLVQAGKFEHTEADWGSTYVQLRLALVNNVTFLQGVRSRAYASNRYHNPDLYIKHSGRIEIRGEQSGSPQTASFTPATGTSPTIVMATGSGLYMNGPKFILDAENAFNPQAGSLTDLRMPCVQVSGSYANSVLDLNGYDQYVGYFNVSAAKAAWAQDLIVTSATPATVTMVESKDVTMRIPFRGAASLTYAMDANQTNKLSAAVSQTTGTLTVESGRLELVNGYQWLGEQVVLTGGELVVSDTAGFYRKTVLFVTTDGGPAMTLPDGGTVTVRALKYNGKWLKKGLYGGAAALAAGRIDADHCLDFFGTESTGVLNVLRDTGLKVSVLVTVF